jgi:hypothetical protein
MESAPDGIRAEAAVRAEAQVQAEEIARRVAADLVHREMALLTAMERGCLQDCGSLRRRTTSLSCSNT